MTKKINTICFFLCSIFVLWACNSSDDTLNTPEIESEDQVQLFAGREKTIIVQGGNNVFEVSSENPLVARSSFNEGELRIEGLAAGETYVAIKSGNKQKKVHVLVKKLPEIGIFSEGKLLVEFVYSLQTEDELWFMDATRPAQAKKLLISQWNSEAKLGETISIEIKKSDFSELPAGRYSALVEDFVGNKVLLRMENLVLVLPRN